ncbi:MULTISPECIES: tyrosine-type recombinase/integrase [unclassified Pseudomonas]|uniref:tyrosine-type recombinase/integrase n=1 Tax=unclassified Pseudomonas TaxID=196821 RepID=UPI00244C4E92|nr:MULTISPECIES: tyrosine-type recombinase/integrase [unclassified Pseudomonas]MDG9927468.1 tyrosine-type recombinase/integrase [Pseudomonas sp. GD04042]MDH0482537.1 tyrosine-type recombinase/integrase [Pseudomonas sp. GD04015]MDH0602889.1 tyrosine-type recombinase/integrase [Pseudomonas sp. GD03869]
MAPPRRRDAKNRNLPDNLYPNGKYWQYRNPITGKKTSINKPLAEAIRLAKAANAKLLPLMADDGKLLSLLTGEEAPTVEHVIGRFENEWLPTKTYAASTLDEILIKLERYRADLGKRMFGQLGVLEMAEYLDQYSNNAYTKHRGLWVKIFAFAVAKGLAERNCAELTLVKEEAEKVRQRHTLEGVQTILAASTTPDWLRRAIRLALLSLQRREDLVIWERTAVDMAANTIRISQGKAENYDIPIHLEIEMGPDLRAVVQECLADPIAGPTLLRYRPRARRREQLEAKVHWSAITEDYLTKEFRKARDAARAYDHIENPKARPTMHELRALGAWLYEQQGFPVEYVQALMGHATEEMTAYYQSGHEEIQVQYTQVQAGLKL